MNTESSALDLLVERLAHSELPSAVSDLVLAAAVGDEALAASVGGESFDRPAPVPSEVRASPVLFMSELAVEGFRGIADRSRLGFRPGPGLTLVVGRNGSGKSSFAEAAELALTGTASRWEKRSKVWEEGWSCLHHAGPRSIEVRLLEEGQAGETVVKCRWAPTDGLDDCTTTAQRPGQPQIPVDGLGLGGALSTWRPFLSYNELGGLLDEGPSRLYDAISAVLGLEEWVEIENRLADARKRLEAEAKAARSEADRLRILVSDLDDERARSVLAALPARKAWDLAVIEAAATGSTSPTGDLAALEILAAAPPIELDDVLQRAAALRAASAVEERVTGTDAGRARDLAGLLEQALNVHRHGEGETCPVCRTPAVLDDEWVERTRSEVERLRAEATAATDARKALEGAHSAARAAIGSQPTALDQPVEGIDTSRITDVWRRWADLPDGPLALADHLESVGSEIAAATAETREAAAAERRRRQDVWQPVAAQLAAWMPAAREVQARQGRISDLKAAASWIADEANRVRNERFVPIAARVRAIWETLRYTSNVALDAVTLEGTKTRRRVELSVSVDDVDGAALSVMSQGELHALALSLFLPRATLPASPFRFLVIDDPVQAMDAARVDGLARTLADVASTHQVIVLTHDERLPDACRRLDLPTTVLEVTRAERSQVTVRARSGPVDNYIADARAVLATEDYPFEARRRVVPGLCRNAIEAACNDATRRRFLLAGKSHSQTDEAIEDAGKLIPRLALALFGAADRGGDVIPEVNRRWGRSAGDSIRALNSGAHELIDAKPQLLISESESLARAIAALR